MLWQYFGHSKNHRLD